MRHPSLSSSSFFFFNDTATTEIYTLSLHDALPISLGGVDLRGRDRGPFVPSVLHCGLPAAADRKSTRLNSSHVEISYAVFCLKKKKNCETGDLVRPVPSQTCGADRVGAAMPVRHLA